MKIRFFGVLFAFLLIAILFPGCGGGGGGSTGAADTSADSLLASQLVGTWKLSEATRNGVLIPVLPTDAGEIGTIIFNANQTATGNDFTISTSGGVMVVDPNNPAPPANANSYKTTAVSASNAVHSWSVSGGLLIVQTASGKTMTNSIEIKNGKFHQTMPGGDVYVWVRG